MLNKFFKTIHNRFSKYLRFIFFLRYLFAIFFIFFTIFLSIPYFFDYEKKAGVVKSYLSKNYNLEITEYEKIKYKLFPFPSLGITNLTFNLKENSSKIKTKNLTIIPKFFSFYNFENFQIKKMVLENNSSTVEVSDFYNFLKKFLKQKNKLSIQNFSINLVDENKSILKLNDMKLSNYRYSKNIITGKIFDKKFKIETNSDLKKINFKIINSGIKVSLNLNKIKDGYTDGIVKSKILNTNLKFSFSYKNKILNIDDFYFRNKNLSFKNESLITVSPYLDMNSKFYVEEFNTEILKKIDFDKLLEFRDIIKKINTKNEIDFKLKQLSLIDDVNLKIVSAYGRINYFKKFSINASDFECLGSINLLEEFPLLFFNCSVITDDKQKLFQEFSIKTKKRQEDFKLNVEGNINLLINKINFKNITTNKDYIASKNDLEYFKEVFEVIFLKNNFLEIFNEKKIKEFVSEIS